MSLIDRSNLSRVTRSVSKKFSDFSRSILLTSRQTSSLELLVAADLMILAKSVLGAFLLFNVLHNPRITLQNRQSDVYFEYIISRHFHYKSFINMYLLF